MSRLPVVAIIGRPNTGKSTLFNSLTRNRLAIVSDIPGTTRDHIASKVDGEHVDYLLLDTGGMGGGTDDKDFEDDVHEQSVLALRNADLILFTVNGKEDITSSDFKVSELLRKRRKRHVPVILLVNKCDNPKLTEAALAVFAELGIGDRVLALSAISNVGTAELREAIDEELQNLHFQKSEEPPVSSGVPRVAIVGKPNVGKSSLVNAFMSDAQRKESPRLVSDVAGTTRDTTDTIVKYHDSEFLFIDTAGLRRQARVEEELESEAILRTIRTIEDCDVIILVIDGTQPISKQDKHIASLAIDAGKGIMILINKSDVLTAAEKEEKRAELAQAFVFCRYAPQLFCSAITRENLLKVFDIITMIEGNRLRRFPVKELHDWLKDQIFGKPMGAVSTTKHITQAKDPPPTFILFVKNPKQVQVSQLRFLENRLRETFGLEGTPVRWITKGPRDRWEEDC
jgi:GTP-binding protein